MGYDSMPLSLFVIKALTCAFALSGRSGLQDSQSVSVLVSVTLKAQSSSKINLS
jgi:hypothetical protein